MENRTKIRNTILGLALWITMLMSTGHITAQSIVGPTSVQAGTTQTYQISGQATGVYWSASLGATILSSNNYSAQIRWDTPNGNYYVSATFNEGPGYASLNVTVSGGLPSKPANPYIDSNECGQVVLRRSGSPPSGVRWYWQTSASGTSTSTYAATYTVSSTGTYYLRARDNSTGGWSETSGSRTVSSITQLSAGSISGAHSVCPGGNPSTLTNSASASGSSSGYSYQWQYSNNGSSGWTNISGATSTSYDPPSGLSASRWYRRRVSCGIQTKYTGSVKVTVVTLPGTPSMPSITNNCESTVLTRGTPPSGVTWYWQSSSSGTSTSNSSSSITRTSGTVYYLRGRSSLGCWGTARTVNYTIEMKTTWYADTDGDGYGDTGSTTSACDQPAGYVSNNSDYDDTTVIITNIAPQTYYKDVDGDGFGESSPTIYASFKPLGYASNASDQCPEIPGTINGCDYVEPSLSDENYIYTRSYQAAMSSPSSINEGKDVIEQVTYFDGLGRPQQQVGIRASGTATEASSPNTPAEWIMDWTEGTGGTSFFNQNGTTAENERFYGPNPFGETDLIWRCGNEPDNGSDGGWGTDYFNVDKTKTYRYMVWVRRDGSQNGSTYHGPQNVDNLGGGANTNPYFWYGDLPQLEQWYLLVGIVHPYTHGGTDTGVSGVYDMEGNKVDDGTEFKWGSGTTTARFRSYFFYSTDVNARQYFYRPILEVVDGNEMPLQEMFGEGKIQDLLTHVGYDGYGRQKKEWLPYPETTGNVGSYRGDVSTATQQYYQDNFSQDFTGLSTANVNAYSEKAFEDSPLNRTLEQAAPGKDWKLDGGHGIRFGHKANVANEVRNYKVTLSYSNKTYTPTLVSDGYYAVGELNRTVTMDENHPGTSTKDHTTEEFTDKQGRVVLKRTYNNEVAHDTYYVYDRFGNLSYVLPPKVVHDSSISATELSELSYQYVYDHRNLLVEKKIPGKGWEYIVYNKLDQPVFTQDANLEANDQWLFTKYDAFGRVAYSGIINYANDRESIVSIMDGASHEYVTRTSSATTISSTDVFYTNDAKPTIIHEVYTVNYYDSYVDADGLSVPATVLGQNTVTGSSLKGLATVSKVRVLGTNDWITTITGYDSKRRAIYLATNNDYLGTTDIVETKLDFAGKVLETKTTHTKGANPAIVTTDLFDYDHMGRLVKQRQILGGNTETVTNNHYDALGQLIVKETANSAQTVDYAYNVRGWLKQINDPNNLGADLFAFGINYNTQDHGGATLFNGNIAETEWKTANDNILRWYRYGYDDLNRIESAIASNTNYSVSGMGYDKNGNILTLQRQGHTNSTATTFGTMDNLVYTYDSGNKLTQVLDNGNDTYGFKDSSVNDQDFWYDANGNMTKDDNKGIMDIDYNHLNLPTNIAIGSGNISYVYDATGTKLQKTVSGGGSVTDYAGNYVYQDGSLQFFNHAEGYVTPDGMGGYDYVYQYKDHLGNIRLSYVNDGNGGLEIVEESNYYPFGLKHKGYNTGTSPLGNDVAQKWKFGGKEYDDSFDINTYDFGARNYDPALGRWMNIDNLAEKMFAYSPYNYTLNNPIYFIDPDGNAPVDPLKNIMGLVDPSKKQWIAAINAALQGNENWHIVKAENATDLADKIDNYLGDTKADNIVIRSHGATGQLNLVDGESQLDESDQIRNEGASSSDAITTSTVIDYVLLEQRNEGNFNDYYDKSVSNSLGALTRIGKKINDNGNLIFTACRAGADEGSLGKALQVMLGERFNIYLNTRQSKSYRISGIENGDSFYHILDSPLQDSNSPGGFIKVTPDRQVIKLGKTLQFNSRGKPVTIVPENNPIPVKKD